jgi:hypothetical protein
MLNSLVQLLLFKAKTYLKKLNQTHPKTHTQNACFDPACQRSRMQHEIHNHDNFICFFKEAVKDLPLTLYLYLRKRVSAKALPL